MLFKSYADKPSFRMTPTHMSDTALSEMLSSRPVLNADVLFYNREKHEVYLPTRRSKPAEGLWFIGGALKAGEQPTDTLVRRLAKETGLSIDPARLELLGLINHLWSYRKEAPKQDGRHDYNFIYALSLTETERKQAETHLDPVEYEVEKGLTPFASATLLTAVGARDVLIDCYQALFPAKE
jgi:ADP-ribose pyrophosphatase YjhB (NUDIX family)